MGYLLGGNCENSLHNAQFEMEFYKNTRQQGGAGGGLVLGVYLTLSLQRQARRDHVQAKCFANRVICQLAGMHV